MTKLDWIAQANTWTGSSSKNLLNHKLKLEQLLTNLFSLTRNQQDKELVYRYVIQVHTETSMTIYETIHIACENLKQGKRPAVRNGRVTFLPIVPVSNL